MLLIPLKNNRNIIKAFFAGVFNVFFFGKLNLTECFTICNENKFILACRMMKSIHVNALSVKLFKFFKASRSLMNVEQAKDD